MPEHQTLDIPNVTTDVGLSPPFNSLFTIFGQFFDHGLDKITNGGNGTVFVPVKADDPLVTRGPDGIAATATRCRRDAHDPHPRHHHARRRTACATRRTPTRRSSTRARPTPRTPSHQVFLRQYVDNNADRPGRHRQVPQHPRR